MVLAEPILVGREKELEQLKLFLESVKTGSGKTVFISGEAGSGKTRLTKEFLEEAKKQGAAVLAGWCLSGAAVPYFPFVEAFTSFESEYEEEDNFFIQKLSMKTKLIGPSVVESSENKEVLNPQIWKDQAFVSITKELLHLSTKKPTILFIDDIHWADSASLALLNYIARAANSERLLVLATFRCEEIISNGDGETPQLAEVLRLMGREGLLKEIKLSTLNKCDVERIAESMLGGKLMGEFAERLTEESRGNPLFVVESLRMMSEQGNLSQENGQWSFTENKLSIPDKVKDVILQRLSTLKPNQRRILNVASVIGEKFDPKLVASALSETSIVVLEALHNVSKSTLLVFVEGNFYRFKHGKIQEMLYTELSSLLRQEYHLKIADSLENSSLKVESLPFSDIAYHYMRAKNEEKTVKYALAAGQDALKRWSNVEAIQHFKNVLQIIEGNAKAIDEKIIALEGLGDAYYASNNFNEAAETFKYLAGAENGAAKLRALRKAMFSAWFKGDLDQLKILTVMAEENANADRLESARVLHQKARVIGLQGQMLLSLEMIDNALVVFEENYALEDAAWVLFVAGHLATSQGQLEKGLVASLRSIALYDEIGDFRSQMEAYLYTGFCFSDATLRQEAINMFKKIIQINDKLKMGDYIHLIPVYACWALNLQGVDLKGAILKNIQALECSKNTDSNLYIGLIYGSLVVQFTIAGDIVHAEEYFQRLKSLPQAILANIFSQVYFDLGTAVYFMGKNQFEEANRAFENYFKFIMANYRNPSSEAGARQIYAWALSKQNKMEQSKTEFHQAEQLIQKTQKRFDHVNVNASLMAQSNLKVNEKFVIRLDLVNVSRNKGSIIKVENLVVPDLEIIDFPAKCRIVNGCIEFEDKEIAPFQVKTVKLAVNFSKTGEHKLAPIIQYADESGKLRCSKANQITVVVQPITCELKFQESVELAKRISELKSESAKKAFDFLVNAFNEDYYIKMLSVEKSGWRSLMQISKFGHVTKHSMYGQMGHGGETYAELKRQRLVESRFFEGERGRGGKILKLRINNLK
jgi:predicted ATPase